MKTRFIQSIFFVVVAVFATSFAVAHAQFSETGTESSVLVTVSPEHPQARQPVSFKVTSYTSNLDTASISWYVNGAKIQSGTGMRTFSTTLGAIGTKTTVKVVVVTKEGETISQTFPFTASTVDLVWEADSYVPPFYKGKALMTTRESGRVVAVPHISASSASLSPTNLIYTWSRDGRVEGDVSGYGKNVFILTGAMTLRPTLISVVVTNKDGSISSEGSVSINFVDPKLVTYFNTPAFGTLYNAALRGTVKLTTKEVNIAAVPYFFAGKNSSSPYIIYDWKMNGRILTETSDKLLTIRNDATTTGMTTISTTASTQIGASTQKQTSSFTLKF